MVEGALASRTAAPGGCGLGAGCEKSLELWRRFTRKDARVPVMSKSAQRGTIVV